MAEPRPTGATPAEPRPVEPQPVNKELLDIENYGGISGRILYSTQFPPAEGRKYLNPKEDIIGIPHVDPNIVRNYNFITDELSKGERDKAWTGQDLKVAYEQIWRPRFTNAVKNTDRDNRKVVIKAITGKDATDITEADVDSIYDKYCRGKSDITAYINDVVNGFTQGDRVNEEEIGDKMDEIQWVASKLFGSKSSEVAVIAAKVEVVVKNQRQETLAKFYTVDRLNKLEEPERALLDVVYNSFKAPAQEPPPAPLAPKEFKSTIELDDREIILEAGASNYSSKGEDSFYVGLDGKVVAVYDGMGGMAAGKEASQISRDFIAKTLEGLPANPSVEQVEQALKQGYENAKQEIIRREIDDPRKKGMGTTASVALLYESEGKLKITALQMGDSRLYFIGGDDQLRQISADYSLVNRDLAQGKITKEEADRINAELDSFTDEDSLSDEAKKYFYDRHVMAGALTASAPEPMVLSTSIATDFKYLLVTSDGVHDNLTKDEIASIFLSNPNAEEAAKQLVEFARKRAFDNANKNSRSKWDDITAAVIKTSSTESVPVAPPAPEPTPSLAPAPATSPTPTVDIQLRRAPVPPLGAAPAAATPPPATEPEGQPAELADLGEPVEEFTTQPPANIVALESRPADFISDINSALENADKFNLTANVPIDTIRGFLISAAGGDIEVLDEGSYSVDEEHDQLNLQGIKVKAKIKGPLRKAFTIKTLSLRNSQDNEGDIDFDLGDVNPDVGGIARGKVEEGLSKMNETFRKRLDETFKERNKDWRTRKIRIVGKGKRLLIELENISPLETGNITIPNVST